MSAKRRAVRFAPEGMGRQSKTGVSMDVEIAKANIAHFKKLLETETDESRREVIRRQLAEEESKLASALKGQSERKKG